MTSFVVSYHWSHSDGLIGAVVHLEKNVSCFAFNAVCVAVDIGLSRSDVLSTFPSPTSDFVR